MRILTAGIILVIGICDAGKRHLRYDPKNWKFGDQTINCLLQAVNSLSTVAQFNKDTGICFTGDAYNRSINASAELMLRSYEPVIVAANNFEVNVIPAVLNLWPSFRNRSMAPTIDVRIPDEGSFDGDRILVEYVDTLNVTNFAIKMEFNDNAYMNISFQDGADWQLASSRNLAFHRWAGERVSFKFYLEVDKIEINLDYYLILRIKREFQPYNTFRFISNFATCERINFD